MKFRIQTILDLPFSSAFPDAETVRKKEVVLGPDFAQGPGVQTELKQIAIAGPGLLGGSVAKTVKTRLKEVRLRIWARRQEVIPDLLKCGFDETQATCDHAAAFADSDLIVLAMPIGCMADFLENLVSEGNLKAGAIVTDVGSVKATVVEKLTPICEAAGAHFVGAHPMAGSEQTGLKYASNRLLQNAPCILTPSEQTPKDVVSTVRKFWSDLEMRVSELSPSKHDEVVARISHLPHALAAILVRTALDDRENILKYSGGGFRSTTRVASGSPEMWKDILHENRGAVAQALRDLQENVSKFLEFLEKGDDRKVAEFLHCAKEQRAPLESDTAR